MLLLYQLPVLLAHHILGDLITLCTGHHLQVAFFLGEAAQVGVDLLVLSMRLEVRLLLEMLERGFYLETLLEVVEGCVLEARVAHEVVELVARFNDVQVQNVVEANDVFLL